MAPLGGIIAHARARWGAPKGVGESPVLSKKVPYQVGKIRNPATSMALGSTSLEAILTDNVNEYELSVV